jgi:exopolysaccharide biosynthesis polyprenyl glycosylphosphotransferase
VDPQTTDGPAPRTLAPAGFTARGRRRLVITILLIASDVLMLAVATSLASLSRFGALAEVADFANLGPNFTYTDLSAVIIAIWLVTLAAEGLYDLDRVFWGTGEYARVGKAMSFGVVAFILMTFALKLPGLSRAWTLLAWAFGAILVVFGRFLVRSTVHWLRRHGRLLRPTLIVGFNSEARDIVEALRRNASSGLVPVACLASSHADQLGLNYFEPDIECLGAARDIVDVLDARTFDTVLLVSTAFDHEVVARIINDLRGRPVDIQMSSGLLDVTTRRILVREVSGVPLITIKGVSFGPWKRVVKRSFDLLVGGVIGVVGIPVWLVISLAILIESRGPVLYRQRRVGRGGREFDMFKFRSMAADADAKREEIGERNEASGPLFKIKGDPRVTAVGRILRKFSLDEVPQLINVLLGEMSLVGPRPPLPSETESYSEYHWRRMEVTPGMTGLWQVSGRSDLSFEEMVRLDLFYIENWSVGFDISMMFRTIPAVLSTEGAY